MGGWAFATRLMADSIGFLDESKRGGLPNDWSRTAGRSDAAFVVDAGQAFRADRLASDRAPARTALSGQQGRTCWPPLAMFKALLLTVWHDLSDVKLAEALEDRASFRRFCGFSGSEPTPERTAFVRFRRLVIAHGLDRVLFESVTADLKARAITEKTGTRSMPRSSRRRARRMRMDAGSSMRAAPQCMASKPMSARMRARRWSSRSR